MQIAERLAGKIDGALSNICFGMIGLFDSIINSLTSEEILVRYPALKGFFESRFVLKYLQKPELLLDVCLLLFSDLSIFIVKRKDILYW